MSEPLSVLRANLTRIRDSSLDILGEIVVGYKGVIDQWKRLYDFSEEPPVQIPADKQLRLDELRSDIRRTMAVVAKVLKTSPLLSEVDLRDLARHTRTMDAALNMKEYIAWDAAGSSDGVIPAGHVEHSLAREPSKAPKLFKSAYDSILITLEYAAPEDKAEGLDATYLRDRRDLKAYRPNTAFLIMRIDPSDRHLEDVTDTIKDTFKSFDIVATRGDEIEHEGKITDRILKEIATSEFLFADLTGERPSVYYEVGYAHAIGKRPMLYQAKGSTIHFDLKDYNCPVYENLGDLRKKLTKRLSVATNRKVDGDEF
jgi:hypothetical protein